MGSEMCIRDRSRRAQDILQLMPEGTTVYTDESAHISAQLTERAVLASQEIRVMYSSMGVTGCDINFDTRMINIWFDDSAPTDTILPLSPRPPNLETATVGERHAAELANTLGTIDYDSLEPSWRLSTTGGTTALIIGRLLHISHDTLQRQLSAHCTHLEYQMHDKTTRLYFAADKKRKMT